MFLNEYVIIGMFQRFPGSLGLLKVVKDSHMVRILLELDPVEWLLECILHHVSSWETAEDQFVCGDKVSDVMVLNVCIFINLVNGPHFGTVNRSLLQTLYLWSLVGWDYDISESSLETIQLHFLS